MFKGKMCGRADIDNIEGRKNISESQSLCTQQQDFSQQSLNKSSGCSLSKKLD